MPRHIHTNALAAFYGRGNRSLIVHPRDGMPSATHAERERRQARIYREAQRQRFADPADYRLDPHTHVLTRVN